MSLLTSLKENALTIVVLVVVLAIGASVYDRFFSSRAKLIAVLKQQIAEQEQKVADLNKMLAQLTAEEEKRLEEIARLKTKLGEIQKRIAEGEGNINDLKNEILELEDALDIIEEHTRNAVDRGRGIAPPDSGAGN